MKKYHTSKLRPDSKHDGPKRQLLAAACVLLCGWSGTGATPRPASAASAEDELRAARIVESTVLSGKPSQAELEKMDGILADLEAKFPMNAAVKNEHAEFLWSMGKQKRAVETWLAAERLDPQNATVLGHLGGSFLAAGDVKQGAHYYRLAMAAAPANAETHFDYANVLFLFRHDLLDKEHPDEAAVYREALRQFGEAVRLQPGDANYARAFAETFYSVPSPDWQAALAAWRHFLDVTPEKDFAWLNIARVQMKLGAKTEAKASLERVRNQGNARLKERLGERIRDE